MRQLLTSMEISRSSLYAAFGDKRQLFIEALHLFSDRTYTILAKVRKETNPAIAIRLFFAATLFGAHHELRTSVIRNQQQYCPHHPQDFINVF
nr:hypothetical protein [Pseudomaricurvus alkylphenolicus]